MTRLDQIAKYKMKTGFYDIAKMNEELLGKSKGDSVLASFFGDSDPEQPMSGADQSELIALAVRLNDELEAKMIAEKEAQGEHPLVTKAKNGSATQKDWHDLWRMGLAHLHGDIADGDPEAYFELRNG